MLRRFASVGVVSLSFIGVGFAPHMAQAQSAPARLRMARKITRTPPTAPPSAPVASPALPAAPAKAAPPKPARPPAPPATPAAPAAPAAPATPAAPAPNSVERARQGVVVLERAGRALALGAVLDGDGRILTALSPLTNGNFLTARYSDGQVVPLKLAHSDRGWDLALLAPSTTPKQPLHTAGLRAARTPSFVNLQTFNLTPPNTVVTAPAKLALSAGLLGGDATTLGGAYDLAQKPALVGGPVVNSEGEVVALVARACPANANTACVPAPYAAPVAALKLFLQRVPAEATWLGVEAASDELAGVRGVRVVSVVPNSPAAVGGLRPGKAAAEADLIVAVDGSPVTTASELNEAVRARTVADTIELLLFGLGRYRHVMVKPRPAPQLTAPPLITPAPAKPPTPNPYR